ncbi:hypothetical protein KKC94_04665 [Patescibacteria group bacterium]|nr:hypothetical protein [Patescibacteria group bacterium]
MAKPSPKTQIKLKVRIPRIIMDIRDADPTLLEKLEPGLETLDARIKVIGEGAETLPHVFSLEEAMEEADIWVVFSNKRPKDLKDIVMAGIVPVMLEGLHPAAENYNPSEESGNAFLFPRLSVWYIYGSLVRAIENFGFTYDWKTLTEHGKELAV